MRTRVRRSAPCGPRANETTQSSSSSTITNGTCWGAAMVLGVGVRGRGGWAAVVHCPGCGRAPVCRRKRHACCGRTRGWAFPTRYVRVSLVQGWRGALWGRPCGRREARGCAPGVDARVLLKMAPSASVAYLGCYYFDSFLGTFALSGTAVAKSVVSWPTVASAASSRWWAGWP